MKTEEINQSHADFFTRLERQFPEAMHAAIINVGETELQRLIIGEVAATTTLFTGFERGDSPAEAKKTYRDGYNALMNKLKNDLRALNLPSGVFDQAVAFGVEQFNNTRK